MKLAPILELAALAGLGFLAVQWWRDREAGSRPAPTPTPTPTPTPLPPTPAKVPWPDADLAPARARAQGYRPLAQATAAQGARARSLLSQWDARSAWPDPSDPSILYVAAMHGGKRAVEVWQRAGAKKAPAGGAAPDASTAEKLQSLADKGQAAVEAATLRHLAAQAVLLGPAGIALAYQLTQKADAIERAAAGA